MTRLPLLPLNTVLFPGGPLPLRIFEPRYLDMVSQCLRDETGIGICLIREGAEVGPAATTYEIGTLSRITYWHQRPDGLLGVTVQGEQRFRILRRQVEPSQLVMAEVELLPAVPASVLPPEYAPMANLLEGIIDQLDAPFSILPRHLDEADWVVGRLVELLPIELVQKQYFLQLNDTPQRLERLRGVLQDMVMWPRE